jgi:hypothetical protein
MWTGQPINNTALYHTSSLNLFVWFFQTGLHSSIPADCTACHLSGILPYNSFFISDHRPCFLDIDGTSLFQSQTFPIAPTQHRILQLYDPRITDKYEGNLNKQLKYHKLEEKINNIHHLSTTSLHSEDTPQQYETIDKLLRESLTYSEKNASKFFSTKFEWPRHCLEQSTPYDSGQCA